ncbi:Anucleate primary sterigmata protein A [Lachnellula arida]|uniref:Anucleate primary sterigmata protein A n=1 Tax=Lachnellula arida TaxID=1316785 RepID=A0A8T9BLF8_9HELO|nr:Anucleate primary sterigmata protein A [Lachnellula arida]
MATSLASDQPSLASQDLVSAEAQEQNDPFLSSSTSSAHHRFSHFDSQLFALGPTTSPEQAKRALEAHLAQTEQRIQDASKIGTTLVQQRKELEDRLKEVEKQQSEGDITPELRQKLIDIEKEYNEVGRESARAFLPKSRVSSGEVGSSPYTGETKRAASPSKFESQATNSPSKLNVPNSRRQRNQPSNRVHDIEFATEISTSLLSQVRHLQALLAEKEEALKTVALEKSRLEEEAEGFSQRLRSLDESEQRYKDENWNLETQIHEYLATAKEAADREKKLSQSLNSSQIEKSAAQKELDEIKLSHAKLSEDHTNSVKHHDVELAAVRRNMIVAENERGALQRKIEDLTGQNQELAKAVAHQRGRLEDRDQTRGFSDEDLETTHDDVTPEHSPPPSPIKGTPRHSMLESETLKSSLHHAHRMIQNLKGNIHREKTEKLELKRMLQDARDDLESSRAAGMGSANGKRNRKVESKEFKKTAKPGQLGGLRGNRSEVFVDDLNWEEDNGQASPSHSAAVTAARVAVGAAAGGVAGRPRPEQSDHFETANETSDAAFETANERATETEDFQTVNEGMSGSEELTETEGKVGSPSRKKPPPLALTRPGNRQSFQSTASTSGEEWDYEEVKTPTAQPSGRLRLKVSRGGNRRSRAASEEPFQSSPVSFANSSREGTPAQGGQTLFAELADMEASDEEDSFQGTPGRSTFPSLTATPGSRPSTAKGIPAPIAMAPPVPKIPMVDSAMMTEPWEPEPVTPQTTVPYLAGAGLAGAALTEAAHLASDKRSSTGTQVDLSGASQWHEEQLNNQLNGLLQVGSQTDARPISTSTYSDRSSQYGPELMDEKLAKFPSPPMSRAHTPMASLSGLQNPAPPLTMSTIHSEQVEPTEAQSPILSDPSIESLSSTAKQAPVPAPLVLSSIQSVNTEPITPLSPRSPRRDAVMIPHDESDEDASPQQVEPETPKSKFLGSVFGWNKNKTPTTPIIAEDETRQSPSDSPMDDTPDSQRPFKELSSNANSNERTARKMHVETTDESSQTALTAEQIDEMLRNKRQAAIIAEDGRKSPVSAHHSTTLPPSIRARKSQESIGSVGRARSKMTEPDYPHDIVALPPKRPTSAGSQRNGSISSIHPPLPADSKKVIAAAAQRSGSSNGAPTPGSMGPPLHPASAYRANNPSFRPRTPSQQPPMSPSSLNDGPTPRAYHSSGGPLQSPPGTARSRRSSVTSFASEVDTRFNLRAGMPMPHGIEPGTDPRMINAITQTMIGEYLWKYTRKAGRGAMSENRHRRYFWVHPYTRTLYWSDRDPSSAGRAELKAKSVPIEAVRVVTDDNPMPPGLHRKSLVIMTPGRAVKFTATTGQLHETWFNALSYLLLRTGEQKGEDAADLANGSLTHEDVAEFSPAFGNNSTRRGPASLSSYNSRTTRNTSPTRKSVRTSMNNPQLVQASTSSRNPSGTLSRLSNYWKQGSSRSRQSAGNTGSIYEASEVHDSAEDLRAIIEKQDRDSDRLENVRACCDGKHDVGHLHTTNSGRGRHAHTVGPASGSSLRPGQSQAQSRNSIMRRTD